MRTITKAYTYSHLATAQLQTTIVRRTAETVFTSRAPTTILSPTTHARTIPKASTSATATAIHSITTLAQQTSSPESDLMTPITT